MPERARGDPGEEQPGAQAEELGQDLLRQRPERHAHPDLAAALADRRRRGRHRCRRPSARARPRRRSRRGAPASATQDEALLDPHMHGLQVVDRQLRVDPQDRLLQHDAMAPGAMGVRMTTEKPVGGVRDVRVVDACPVACFSVRSFCFTVPTTPTIVCASVLVKTPPLTRRWPSALPLGQ